ncbi:MAG: DUF4012 domain-containing protein [Patescibacteria group bacterium]
MSKKVPKKNISSVLVDIKKPNYDYKRLPKFETVNLGHIPQAPVYVSRKTKGIVWGVVGVCITLLMMFFALTFFNLNDVKVTFAESAETIVKNFSSSVTALKEFRPDRATASLKKNNIELVSLQDTFNKSYGQALFDLVGGVVPAVKDAGDLIGKVSELNSDLLRLTETLSALQTNGFRYFQSDGTMLIRNISEARELVRSITNQIESLRNTVTSLKSVSPVFEKFESVISENYLTYGSELRDLDQFLGGVIDFLKSGEKHILVFFQNTAEIRPGGGFIGSYADVTIKNGQLAGIDVRDIYDPDGQLDLKVVPPQEIKTMTQNWGARDANWFFDFPTSAKTVIYFLENSKMYSEKNIAFDGAIGLNLNVMKSVLGVIGPVPLEEYKVVIDDQNFLKEIQKEVETGKDKIAGEPKRILKVLAPIILERMKILSQPQLQDLVEKTGEHFSYKDIMVYMKNQDIQHFIEMANIDGGVFKLPNNFWGSYLGVVNTNVAGGKTDVFMDELVEARIDVDTSGGTFTDLQITRSHLGKDEKDPWWKATNKNFIQVYAHPNASLISLKGNDVKNLFSNFDYDANGYMRLPQLESIEKTKIFVNTYQTWTMQAFGKTAFGTWFNVPAGVSKILSVRYQTPGDSEITVSPGKIFTFVFDKQSGVSTHLRISISAPLGYTWIESEGPVFSYENDNPESRVTLLLTLKKQ